MPKQLQTEKRKGRGTRPPKSRYVTGSGPTFGVVPRSNFLSTHISSVPQTMRETLSWNTSNFATVAAATYSELLAIIGNSPFDPATAVGTQAVGFAKLMAFYTKCFVLGYRVKIKMVLQQNTVAAAPVPIWAGITDTTSTASLATINGAINPGLVNMDIVGASPDHHAFETSIDVSKFLNKPRVLDDPQLFTTSAANPSQLIVSHFWVDNVQNSGNLIVNYTAELTMDCVFTDPTPFA